MFPQSIKEQLRVQVDTVRGYGQTIIPEALARKYPSAARELIRQFIFPSKKPGKDPRSGILRCHHVLESGLQKVVRKAVLQTGITKHVTCHTFRHSFATHLLENGVNIRIVQEMTCHANVKATEMDTHVRQRDLKKLRLVNMFYSIVESPTKSPNQCNIIISTR